MYIQDSRYRILYQLISAAVFGHREIIGDLNNTDIHIMYSILNNQYLCPALYIARACMKNFPGEWDNHSICGGKFVTKLAESYGLLTTNFISTLEPVGRVYILDIQQLTNPNELNHKSWVLLHDASPNNSSTQEILPEAIHTEPIELVSDQPGPNTVLESWAFHPGASSSRRIESSSYQGASSSVPEFTSFQNLLESPKIPSYQTLLGLPEIPSSPNFPEFPDLLLPEVPPQLTLEEIFQETSPLQTFHPGVSFPQQGVPTDYQNILLPPPSVQAQPTLEDLYREVMEMKKNMADLTASTMEIKRNLADLNAWLMRRFS